MNSIELYNKACARLDSGATLAELSDDEYRVFMFTRAVNSVIDLAKRFKARPLDVAEGVEDMIINMQKSGKIKANYGKPADDADDDFPLF